MKPSTIIGVSACGVLLGLFQLLTLIVNPWVGIAGGVAIATLGRPLLAFFQAERVSQWAGVLIPSLSSIAATSLVFLTKRNASPLLWLAPSLALLASALTVSIRNLQLRRCALCDRRLNTAVAFSCPRCALLTCDHCWIFERSRCRLCEENGVAILPADARWWDKQTGPRAKQGRCQICMATADKVDLRSCKKCGRLQCRDCWDVFANGQCIRCGWTIPDMPKSLRPYVIATKDITDNRGVRLPRRGD
jgi:hypothetical protein